MTYVMNRSLSEGAFDFINDAEIEALIALPEPEAAEVDAILAKSLDKQPLTMQEASVLVRVKSPELRERIFEAARTLKQRVYGNRIVLFAPLYVGNLCRNDCTYCAFRKTNREAVRRTLESQELVAQVEALEDRGHKRLILVFGEHPHYNPQFIADTVRTVYSVKKGKGEIRRVNINAAPLDHEGYRIIKDAGIGTYQIFHETYHHVTYAKVHPEGTTKGDYLWRLDGPARAMEAGCDDVGLGALFGLYDWRFETLGLVAHANALRDKYKVGPHTISFPRIQPASGVSEAPPYLVNDEDFKLVIATLRLAVPYTGLILTARESATLRREVMAFGVSQIDAGSRIEIGGYTELAQAPKQVREREQFELGDIRPLDEVLRELLVDGYIPSFCTACYRLGRTGEHFMEFAVPGFIKTLCSPNALLTLMEYVTDYGSPDTVAAAEQLIAAELAKMEEGNQKRLLQDRLDKIRKNEARDLYF